MSDSSTITIEINGKTLEVKPGVMLIEAADSADIDIPRFCYHKKLSIAANCRMCLVDVENSPKPLPACATVVADGMKVFTKSARAIAAQKATMEFLLINHPLDCPICDQGGECELQDVAMGYGGDISRYTEGKRVVKDRDIGPLIATDLTRCIHCTRCIRFGTEIAGLRELGATGRGENMKIGTYIEKSVSSELSGNIIDLCPVGALTAKPSRYTARAWELNQYPSIAAHDCVGSHIAVHTFRSETNRIVPFNNPEINECWLSDRDRFSYKGLASRDRLKKPMIKVDGQWRETDWQTALEKTFAAMQDTIRNYGADQIGVLASPNSTLEELYLLKKLTSGIDCNNYDHRLRQTDFSHQTQAPLIPTLGSSIQDLENLNAILLVGSNICKEQPILGIRLRAAANKGAKICQINHRVYDLRAPCAVGIAAHYRDLVLQLAGVAKALKVDSSALPHAAAALFGQVTVSDDHTKIAEILTDAEKAHLILGNQALASPYYSLVEVLARAIASATNCLFGYLTDGANSTGAWLMGALPHRDYNGGTQAVSGLNAKSMLEQPRNLYLLHNIEIDNDCADPVVALSAVASSDFVICMTPYLSSDMQNYADILLPIAPYLETSGTFVNIEGKMQTFRGAGALANTEARPAWKIIRVLGNYFDIDGFEFNSSKEVLDEIVTTVGDFKIDNEATITEANVLDDKQDVIYRCSEVNMYHTDSITRRSMPLQNTPEATDNKIRINTQLAKKLGLERANQVLVKYGNKTIPMHLAIDDTVADDCAWTPFATSISKKLGPMYGVIELEAD